VAPSSSSTRKASRLAQKGKGKRVRFQGGTLFPLVVALVLVIGLGLIVYARASQPAADASAPQPGIDHWHGAYGFQICTDTPQIMLTGNLEDKDAAGDYVYPDFVTTGVHSHDDGVIHWHPYGYRAAGKRAKLGVFLDNYGVSLTNDKLVLPKGPDSDPLSKLSWTPASARPNSDDFSFTYEEGEQQCNGKDATLKVVVWTDYRDPHSEQTYTTGFDDIPFDRNGLVYTIAFVPDDVDVVMPTWAADLPRLGAIDNASADSPTASTEPGAATGSTPGSSLPGDNAPTALSGTEAVSTEAASTAPTASTDVPSTTAG
jgi:hypothetical protein